MEIRKFENFGESFYLDLFLKKCDSQEICFSKPILITLVGNEEELDLQRLLEISNGQFIIDGFFSSQISPKFLEEFFSNENIFYLLSKTDTAEIETSKLPNILRNKVAIFTEIKNYVFIMSNDNIGIQMNNISQFLSLISLKFNKVDLLFDTGYLIAYFSNATLDKIKCFLSGNTNEIFSKLKFISNFLNNYDIGSRTITLSIDIANIDDINSYLSELYSTINRLDLAAKLSLEIHNSSSADILISKSISPSVLDLFRTSGIQVAKKINAARKDEDFYKIILNEIKRHISPNANDLDKVVYITSFVARYLSYRLNGAENIAVTLDNGIAQCYNYAELTNYLLNMLGVSSEVLNTNPIKNANGNINNPGHALNIVYINGKKYFLDVTAISYYLKYGLIGNLADSAYFLVSTERMIKLYPKYKESLEKVNCSENMDRNLIKESENRVLGKKDMKLTRKVAINQFKSGQPLNSLRTMIKGIYNNPIKFSKEEIQEIIRNREISNVARALFGEPVNENRKNIDDRIIRGRKL